MAQEASAYDQTYAYAYAQPTYGYSAPPISYQQYSTYAPVEACKLN